MGYETELAAIVEQTSSIADPLERVRERQRLTRELYAEPFERKVNRLLDAGMSVQEIAAETGRTVEAARAAIEGEDQDSADADEAEALAVLAEAGLMLVAPSPLAPRIAETQEQLAGTFPAGSEIADRLRRNAQQMRRYAKPSNTPAAAAPALTPPRAAPRPRARRERHVARATSSADSGDDGSGGSDPPPLARPRRALWRSRAPPQPPAP